MINVLIVDDHELVRRGLKQVINETEEFRIADEASDERRALELIRKNKYDVMVLDISLGERNGLQIFEHLKNEAHQLKVLIYSMHPEEQYAIQAIKAGASGYLTKSSTSKELILALKKIVCDKVYLSEGVSEELVRRIKDPADIPAHETLSPREFQIFLMIAEGKSVKEISNELGSSSNSVSTHRARILEKMNLKNNADIIHYAFRNGFID